MTSHSVSLILIAAAGATACIARASDERPLGAATLKFEQFKRAVFSPTTKRVYLQESERTVVWNSVADNQTRSANPLFLFDPYRRMAERGTKGKVIFGSRNRRASSPELLIVQTTRFESKVALAKKFVASSVKRGD